MGEHRKKYERYPALRCKDVEKALIKAGAVKVRQKGSHAIYKLNNKTIVVPLHKGNIMPEGTLRSIIRQAGLKKDEFYKFVNFGLILYAYNFLRKIVMIIISIF